ncbi:MAG: rimM [Gammaproteobacteria bacterium]|nr:rimM [Gammaproteobacteria bacterium]
MTGLKTDYVVVGKLGSTYGIQGWLKLYSFTEPRANISLYKPWYVEDGTSWKLAGLEVSSKHAKGIIVKFSGYNTPEEARQLTGKRIAVLRSQLPHLKKGEFYWRDLEGIPVINQEGAFLGKVMYLLETGSNDVLVVKNENKKEHAIPYLAEVIKKVDLVNQVIYVDWELI